MPQAGEGAVVATGAGASQVVVFRCAVDKSRGVNIVGKRKVGGVAGVAGDR